MGIIKPLAHKMDVWYDFIHGSSNDDLVCIRIIGCRRLTIPYLGLIYYCFFSKRKSYTQPWQAIAQRFCSISVIPKDAHGEVWTFKKVVERYGYPMFSKRVSNAIRTYQHALTARTKANAQGYIDRNFKKYEKYKELPISDKCCDKLKKEPLRRKAKELGLECAILGILASESYQREKDWLEYGCNVFHERNDNQSRPLSFWTDEDILEYIEKYDVKIPKLYKMGYTRNGCMYCGFGVHLEPEGCNRYQKLKETHPIQYSYFIKNFGELMVEFEINVA